MLEAGWSSAVASCFLLLAGCCCPAAPSTRLQRGCFTGTRQTPMASARSTGARSRSPASARAAEQRYESPWLSLRPARFSRLMELLHTASQRPVTEDQFRHALSSGASEHIACLGNRSSRSTSHYLSTMARSITALIRTRAESNPARHEILPKVIACAYCIANKSSARGWPRVVPTLYDFQVESLRLCSDASLARASTCCAIEKGR